MCVKIITLDLDGTLLNSEHKVSQKNIKTLTKASNAGVKIVIGTGRVFEEIPLEVRKFDKIDYFITSNGGAIYSSDEKLMVSNYIDKSVSRQCFEVLKGYNVFIDLYIGGTAYVSQSQLEEIHKYRSDDFDIDSLMPYRNIVSTLEDIFEEKGEKLEKINLFFVSKEQRDEAINELYSKVNDISLSYSMGSNLEINSCTSTKGSALKSLAERLNIDSKNVMAIGDSNNDLTMLKYANYSVAMGNASDDIKNVTKHLTTSCDEDGVANAVNHIVLESKPL